MKLIQLIFLLSLPCLASGQNIGGYTIETRLDDILNPSPHIMRERMGGAAYGTKGSPMIFDDFTKGNIYYSNKSKTSGKLINYNCHTHEVLYSDGNNSYLLSPKEIDYLEFLVYDQSLIFKHIFLEDLQKSLFVQVLYNDQSILYKRHYREFLEADYTRAYSADRRYDEYVSHYDYYLSPDGGDVIPLKPKKKNLLTLMNLHSGEIEAFLKAEKINLKSDKDLVKVVKYYDSLSAAF